MTSRSMRPESCRTEQNFETSMAWNNLVTNLSIAKRESRANALLGRKGVLREMKGEPNQDAKGESKGGKAKSDKAAGAAEGGVEGKRGKEGRVKDVAANDEGAEGRDEDDYDDRFAVLRGKLAKALLRRQRELAQTLCSLCDSPLLRPTRLVACRHVLCALCVERSILYHRVCPVCATPNGACVRRSANPVAPGAKKYTAPRLPLVITTDFTPARSAVAASDHSRGSTPGAGRMSVLSSARPATGCGWCSRSR